MQRIERTITGGCQCGAVRYRADAMLDNAHICHCRMCQKAVGNLFAALVAAPDEVIVWTRGRPAIFASSSEADRGFCRDCGTPLFYRGRNSGRTNFTMGSLDDPAAFPPLAQVGTEARVSWFADLCSLHNAGETGSDGDAEWAEAIRVSNHQHPDHDTTEWPPAPQ